MEPDKQFSRTGNDWAAAGRPLRSPRYSADRQSGNAGSIGFALVVTTVGVLFLLRNMEVIQFEGIGQLWPLAMMIPGLSMLLGSRSAGQALCGFAITTMGGFFLLRNFGIFYPGLMQWFWPTLLIGAGVLMLIQHLDQASDHDFWRGGDGGPASRERTPRDPQQPPQTGSSSQ